MPGKISSGTSLVLHFASSLNLPGRDQGTSLIPNPDYVNLNNFFSKIFNTYADPKTAEERSAVQITA